MTTPVGVTGRQAALVAGLLSLCIAAWEIDPRWITEAVDGLTTIQQTELNKDAQGGSQRIAWVAAPLTALLGLVLWRTRGLRSSRPMPGRDWIGAWLAWSVVSALFGPSPVQALVFSSSFIVIALATRLLTRHSPTLATAAMLGGMVVFVAFSLATRLLGFTSVSVRAGRLTMLSLEANQFSRMATFGAIGGLHLALTARDPIWRLVGALGGAGALAAVAMTGSRTGFMATGIALLVLLLTLRNRLILAVLGTTAVTALALLGVSDVGRSALDSLTRDSTSDTAALTTLTGRTDIWPVVVDAIAEKPLAGHGLGTETLVLSPRSADINFIAEHTHNAPLHLLLTTGAVGAVLFGLAAGRAMIGAASAHRPWVWAIGAYLSVAGATEALFRNPDITLVGLIFALTLADSPPGQSDSDRHRPVNPRVRETV